MSTRIITIDRHHAEHWEHAKRNGFWDLLTNSNLLHSGDDVLFWVTDTPGRVVGRAVLRSDPTRLSEGEPHAWSDADPRRGTYTYRVELEDFTDVRSGEITFGEARQGAGLGGRLNPVTPVPDGGVSWLEQRLSISLDPRDRALARLGTDMNFPSGSELDIDVFDHDTRQRVPVGVVIRRGQRRFRDSLMVAYGGRCAITGTALPAILEAAHISPFHGDHTNAVANGLLLRADIHTLFDLHLLTLTYDEDDGYQVRVAPDAAVEPYRHLDGGRLLLLPGGPWSPPEPRLLDRHNEKCLWLT